MMQCIQRCELRSLLCTEIVLKDSHSWLPIILHDPCSITEGLASFRPTPPPPTPCPPLWPDVFLDKGKPEPLRGNFLHAIIFLPSTPDALVAHKTQEPIFSALLDLVT